MRKLVNGVWLEGLVEPEDLARLPVDFVVGPFRRVEQVLVIGPISFPGEEKIGGMIVFLDDGSSVIVEGDENALGVFSGAFIFEGDPEAPGMAHEHVRTVEGFREGDVVLEDQFSVVVETAERGLLDGQVVQDV